MKILSRKRRRHRRRQKRLAWNIEHGRGFYRPLKFSTFEIHPPLIGVLSDIMRGQHSNDFELATEIENLYLLEQIETFQHQNGQFVAQFIFPDGQLRYCQGQTPSEAIATLRFHHPELKNVEIKTIPTFRCADCGGPIGKDGGPPDGWQLEGGRTVCQACCISDLK